MNRFKRFLLVGVGAALVVTAFTAPAYATYGGSNGKLAFSRGGAIVSQSPGGGAEKQLAAGLVTSPSYSPNGKKVVFLRGDALLGPGWVDVWIMNADGSGKKNLTNR